MINLLPEDSKREVQAARVNVILLRYNLLLLSAFAALAATCLLFYVILFSAQSNAVSTNSTNTQEASKYTKVQEKADQYKQDLATAKAILDRGVNYTSFIIDLTKLLPSGVILGGINLSAADIGKQVSFTSQAASYDKAIELKRQFERSFYYTNIHFQNITDAGVSEDPATKAYPITVTMSVLVCDGVCPDKQAAYDKEQARLKAEADKKAAAEKSDAGTEESE